DGNSTYYAKGFKPWPFSFLIFFGRKIYDRMIRYGIRMIQCELRMLVQSRRHALKIGVTTSRGGEVRAGFKHGDAQGDRAIHRTVHIVEAEHRTKGPSRSIVDLIQGNESFREKSVAFECEDFNKKMIIF
ncbi:hypothetical protein BGZ65_001746, partial [Modicella reniformis]